MQIAFLSDIHGNPLALDAVLADIDRRGGVDSYWFLGDFSAIGPQPVAVIERVNQLANTTLLRGNTDRYLVTGERPRPRQEDLEKNPALGELFKTIDLSFSWTLDLLNAAGRMEWIANLPLEQRTILPDGTRLLAVHASPGKDDGKGIMPTLTDAELAESIAGAEADLILVGHTHWPVDRVLDGVRVVNLGSLSNPFPPDLRASYVLLQADRDHYQLEHHRVEYDRDSVVDHTRQVGHPASGYIINYMTGKNRPSWEQR